MMPAQTGDPYADYGWASLRLFLKGWQPVVARDARYEYSNLGFGLLGHALALRAGTDYLSLLGRRVLAPLGLRGLIGVDADLPRPVLPGHDSEGRPVPPWHFQSVTAGAGALRGSVRGVTRYAQAALGQFDHPLHAAFTLCLQRHADGAAPINPIGLAWLLAPLNGRTVFNHDGGTGGFSSSLWLDPQRGRASVVLANAQVPVNDLALHLLDRSVPLRDLAATTQPAIVLPAAQLQPYAGVYALNPQFRLSIRADGGRLFAQATGQGEFELFAKAPRRFFAKITPLEVEFDAADGAPPALTLFQGAAKLRFVRD
jgi:CubicO group peptidase (beta-lactamase class C family)